MSGVKVPSLQHLARVYDNSPEKIKKNLLKVADGTPIFGYNQIYPFVMDYLSLGTEYDQVMKGINLLKSDLARKNYTEIFPLIKEKYEVAMPSFVFVAPSSSYAISRDLLVPFTPAMFYRIGSARYLPWFIFWRQNPLKGENFSLLATLIREMMDSNPDLSSASLQFIDFSAPKQKASRTLRTFEIGDIPTISHQRKIEMLEIFAEGYCLAKEEFALRPIKPKKSRKKSEILVPKEQEVGLFDFP